MANKVKDPICGMMIDPDRAAGRSVSGGQTVYFCSTACKAEFDRAHPAG
jgi:Cu+-exporting ATPase